MYNSQFSGSCSIGAVMTFLSKNIEGTFKFDFKGNYKSRFRRNVRNRNVEENAKSKNRRKSNIDM